MKVNRLLALDNCQGINFLKVNEPGIYFLFDKDKKLIYIGESIFPMSRILDHYYKSYKAKKGIGPIFNYFRIINCKSKDSRVRQHFEKRWIRKFKCDLNSNTKCATYDLSWPELKSFILIFENFFKKNMTWYRYLNDQVMRQRNYHKSIRSIQRKKYYKKTGK